jgi:hypothetical protein
MLEDYGAGLDLDCAAPPTRQTAARRYITRRTRTLCSTRDDLEDLCGDVLSV